MSGNNVDVDNSNIDIKNEVDFYIKSGMSSMDAIKKVAKENSLKKNDVYYEYHRGDN